MCSLMGRSTHIFFLHGEQEVHLQMTHGDRSFFWARGAREHHTPSGDELAGAAWPAMGVMVSTLSKPEWWLFEAAI